MKMFIKGFDSDLKCRDFQFEIGKTYETGANDDTLELCSDTVFRFCRSLRQVHSFYNVHPNNGNRFCEIEVLGRLIEDDEKCGSNKIKIIREIKGEELQRLRGLERGNTGIFNTGNCNTGDWNTGNGNTGDCNTGNGNTGRRNTGNRNTGDWNTGNWNTGDCNTGDCNAGNCNAGDRNTGHRNTGNGNTGCRNTGDCNAGDRNTGFFNKCNNSTGFFNTKERTITIFNKDSGMTYEECRDTDWYKALFSEPFVLTERVKYTDEEKKDSIIRQCIGGYLKSYTFHEACRNWWKALSDENKAIIQTMPNFDKGIFEGITGIEVE